MSSPQMFVLTPCKLREDRIVPVKDTPTLLLDWNGVLAKLAPNRQPSAMTNLRRMDKGSFIGLARDGKTSQVRNFILKNVDRSDKVDWLLAKDPSFPDRLVEVYRVEVANWETTVSETGTPEQRTT